MNTPVVRLAESENDLEGILQLQQDNHVQNISADIKNKEGFVTVKHSLEDLKQMNSKAKQIIAVYDGKVVAYALVMVPEFSKLIPVLTPMFDTFDTIDLDGIKLSQYKYYVMGQICVAQDFRGMGLVSAMYTKHKEVYSGAYDIILTEVSSSNPRSMRAHEKIGFKTIHTFRDVTDEWYIIGWQWN
ncbi:GNAT family N-acetyltransferase [Fulvivirga ligni]|uniref:GNAT family N-acetyltransferase n=1 Tax=Fulvivirga ligni TaxID=2904246 RepID=UPI001F27F5B1|nr:GNAT family N-acetyltransferase [Fulvivirga ligni]UII23619.1 GNAT family N-acetyltransferase [Fulvivirga ligni]